MLLKRELTRRVTNLILFSFLIFVVFMSSYFYISSETRVSSVSASIEVLRGVVTDGGQVNTISENVTGIQGLVVLQVIIFLIATISLISGLWFTIRLYLIEKKNAYVDPLTDIYNKRAIMYGLEREIRRAARYGHPLSVAILDIDYFKKYNDTNGHVAGDHLLKKFANILVSSVREYDFVGRIGGEEFLIIFPETDLKKALATCERIRETVGSTYFGKEQNLPTKNVTVSIGVSEFVGDKAIEKEHLIHRADILLYKAKESGRNRVVY